MVFWFIVKSVFKQAGNELPGLVLLTIVPGVYLHMLFLKRKIFSWVFGCEYIFLFGHCDMGINFCYFNRTVPKHFLDITYVDICFKQVCGEGMAEHVRGNMYFNACK